MAGKEGAGGGGEGLIPGICNCLIVISSQSQLRRVTPGFVTADFFRVLCCFIRINTGPIGDDVSKKFHFDKDANLVRQIEGEKTYHVHFSFIFSPEG